MSYKNAILRLKGEATIWYEGLKGKISREGKKKISSWESLKCKLRRRYVAVNHPITIIPKFSESRQKKLDVIDFDESLGETIVIEESSVVTVVSEESVVI
ncbi:unnamed protein product [Lactuca virosa]|uniref:Retrotransposon gag domain-containing protein n=1 Tax=Lactuca virosa TaxID=75947 RepID=A0AAU9NED4_9ASTR|nr:unnamed protein product [Lactuca virosa]